MIYVFDIEVFKHDWLIVFKNMGTGEYKVIHNDNYELKTFISPDDMYAGFNNKHYDNHIIKAFICGADNALVKELNDFIIGGNLGWEHWFIRQNRAWFNSFDIRDDMQMGLSLKAIEGHLGMNIEETSVPFDIDRPLTKEELEETIKYCKHDVDTTEQIIKLRKPYLDGKLALGQLKGFSPSKSLYMTNAKMTAAFLEASRRKWDDERNYQYPHNLKRERVPTEVFEFFDRMHDPEVNDDELFKSKLDFQIGGCPCVIGFGGIHGAVNNYSEEDGKRIIRNFDVASLYPSLMIKCGYTSRNIPSPESFEKVYKDRLKAKREGDKRTSDTLKLVLNTTYGAMLNQYNDLFDPLMGRSVCISGQLFLTELACSYIKKCKTITLIQINTDGIMFSIDEDEMPTIYAINEEWQTRTGFELEEDRIKKIVQKDVNNYVMVTMDDKVKVKGGYLTYGISKAGAWNINNNATIVNKALIEHFVNGTPVEETINNCNDILEFQLIAKAGSKYREAYHLINGKKIPIQKVNRVYASKDTSNGKLYKVHRETGRAAKVEGLPEHCIIDNDNTLTIQDVDKQFYIDMAKKRVSDFIGQEENMNEYVRLTELAKVPGIGEKTMERIRAECEIFTLDAELEKPEKKNEALSTWLDELLESEN